MLNKSGDLRVYKSESN